MADPTTPSTLPLEQSLSAGLGRGVKLGASAVLVFWLLWDSLVDPPLGADFWHDPALQVYRGLGNLILLLWMWLLSVHLWRKCDIDFARLLGLPPPPPPSPTDPKPLLHTALDLTIAFLVSLICFYKAIRGVFLRAINPSLAHLFPLGLLLFLIYEAVTPWAARKPVWVAVWRVLLAPFGPSVTFADGYVGDILTSLVRVLIDLAFTVLFFLAGIHGWATDRSHLGQDQISTTSFFRYIVVSMLTASPLWWRFSQNLQRAHATQQRWPHIGNALKYASAQSVSLWGVWQPQLHASPVWILAFVFTTLYQFTWDVTMDWGLFRLGPGGIQVRRRRLVGGGRLWIYYAATAINFALRFVWTLSLLPEKGNRFLLPELQLYLSPFIAAAEICRRTMWGVFRLEWEQLEHAQDKDMDAEEELSDGMELDGDWQRMDVGASSALYLPMQLSKYGGMYFNADVGSSGTFVIELGALAALVVMISGAAALA